MRCKKSCCLLCRTPPSNISYRDNDKDERKQDSKTNKNRSKYKLTNNNKKREEVLMREVCVFLTQQLYDDNPKFVVGLRKNRIAVHCSSCSAINTTSTTTTINNSHHHDANTSAAPYYYDDDGDDDEADHTSDSNVNNRCINNSNPYQRALRQHYERLLKINTDHSHKGPQPRLCLVFEQSLDGIKQALEANMTVIGITTIAAESGDGASTKEEDGAAINDIEGSSTTTATTSTNRRFLDSLQKQFQDVGAHVVATSIPVLLQQFHIERYYQVQYLPYVIQLRLLANTKIGYPVSFLDNLSGQFQFMTSSSSISPSSNHDERTARFLVDGSAAVVGDADDVVGPVAVAAIGTSSNDSFCVIDGKDQLDDDMVINTTPKLTRTTTTTTNTPDGQSSARFVLDQVNSTTSNSSSSSSVRSGRHLDPGSGGRRVVPRRVLGIEPGSLADVYINNVGWPQDSATIFKLESRELELDIVRMFGRYYHCHDGQLRGYVTTGGTEGNFTALWWNRDYLRSTPLKSMSTSTMMMSQQLQNAYDPILLTSNQTHYSVHKAAQQLMIEERLVDTDKYGSLSLPNLSKILDQINEDEPMRPIIMNVNLGTTQTGALDPLPDIHRVLVEKVKNSNNNNDKNRHSSSQRRRFVIHVDAALMGACLPIVQPFGPSNVNMFDSYDVTTMAISGHKFFGSVCICGLCLTTAKFLNECDEIHNLSNLQSDGGDWQHSEPKTAGSTKSQPQPVSPRRTWCGGDSRVISYTGGLHDRTLGGSRSGFNSLSFHNTLCALQMHTNFERLKVLVNECYHSVSYFLEEMEQIVGPNNIIHPQHSLIVCFRPRPSQFIMEQYQIMPVDIPRKTNTIEEPTEFDSSEEKKADDVYQSDSDCPDGSCSDPRQQHQYAGICILVNIDRVKIDRFVNDYRKDRMLLGGFS